MGSEGALSQKGVEMNTRMLGKSKAVDPEFYLGLAVSIVMSVIFFYSAFEVSFLLTFSAGCLLLNVFEKKQKTKPISLLEVGMVFGAIAICMGAVLRMYMFYLSKLPS